MRFIELLFGLSPDKNSGATEAAILAAISVGVMAICYVARRLKQGRQGGTSL